MDLSGVLEFLSANEVCAISCGLHCVALMAMMMVVQFNLVEFSAFRECGLTTRGFQSVCAFFGTVRKTIGRRAFSINFD